MKVSSATPLSPEDCQQLLSLLKALDETAIISKTDVQGNMTFVNENFCYISGYSEKELLGKNHRIIKSRVHPPEFFQSLWKTLLEKKKWRGEVCNQKKDGSLYWVDNSIIPILDNQNRIKEYISIRFEITQQKKLEKNLIEAKEEAQKAHQAKSEFLSLMSHELRTPLNAIQGALGLLKFNNFSPMIQSQLQIIQLGSEQLFTLIQDILLALEGQQSKTSHELISFNLKQLLEETCQAFQTLAVQKKLSIVLDPLPLWTHEFFGEASHLRQVLSNLLSNAIKFSHPGLIHLRASETQSLEGPSSVRIEVLDTGPGLSESATRHLFERFQPGNIGPAKSFGGTGLGLSIAHQLVTQMNGRLFFQPLEPQGSLFGVELPLATGKPLPSGTPTTLSFFSKPENPLRILVAEDNAINQKIIIMQLKKLGHHADVVSNGEEALEQLSLFPYDLILMDLQMPKLDGYETTKCIRQSHSLRSSTHLPIIALTANALEADRTLSLEIGMNDFLTKPLSIEVLEKTLNKWITAKENAS